MTEIRERAESGLGCVLVSHLYPENMDRLLKMGYTYEKADISNDSSLGNVRWDGKTSTK